MGFMISRCSFSSNINSLFNIDKINTHKYVEIHFQDHHIDDTYIINPELPESIQEKSHFTQLEV